jgi:hypothetical protein
MPHDPSLHLQSTNGSSERRCFVIPDRLLHPGTWCGTHCVLGWYIPKRVGGAASNSECRAELLCYRVCENSRRIGLALALSLPDALPDVGQQAEGGIASLNARPSSEWLKSGVHQVSPRSFSAEGNLQGVTRRLNDLHDLGVNIVWLMPIHLNGVMKRKGSLGSPYAVRVLHSPYWDRGISDRRKLFEHAISRQRASGSRELEEDRIAASGRLQNVPPALSLDASKFRIFQRQIL